jgi:hypothetical protein
VAHIAAPIAAPVDDTPIDVFTGVLKLLPFQLNVSVEPELEVETTVMDVAESNILTSSVSPILWTLFRFRGDLDFF